MSDLPDDFTELLPKAAAARDPRPAYYLWVWDPDTDTLYIDHNEDKHPAWKHTWQSLAHAGADAVKGRAYPIEGGWRIRLRGDGDADPFIVKHVLKALREKHPPKSLPVVGQDQP